MEGNLTPGRARQMQNFTRLSDDIKDFSEKTALPQKVYCSVDMRTISQNDPAWCHLVCDRQYPEDPDGRCWRSRVSLNESKDNYYHSNAEIRYDRACFYEDVKDKELLVCTLESFDENQIGSIHQGKRGKHGFKGRVGRNARERRRVRAVSGAFLRLRKAVSAAAGVEIATSKRLSKLKTLKSAIDYINELQQALFSSKCSTMRLNHVLSCHTKFK